LVFEFVSRISRNVNNIFTKGSDGDIPISGDKRGIIILDESPFTIAAKRLRL